MQRPEGRDSLEKNLEGTGQAPFFINGCIPGAPRPIVADKFPQFATRPAARDYTQHSGIRPPRACDNLAPVSIPKLQSMLQPVCDVQA